MKGTVTLAIYTLLLFVSHNIYGQTFDLETNWWVPNGTVSALHKDAGSNILYIGGRFDYIGPIEPYGTPININTGIPEPNYDHPNGPVEVVEPDGNGGWYIGGNFTHVAGVARSRLARVSTMRSA